MGENIAELENRVMSIRVGDLFSMNLGFTIGNVETVPDHSWGGRGIEYGHWYGEDNKDY